MMLATVVATSDAVAATRSRKAKTAALAGLLSEMDATETGIAVAYLAGEIPQGRIGLGYAAVYAAEADPAPAPTLTLGEVDATLTEIAAISGAGSKAARHETLVRLLTRATNVEQTFLRRLILRELRQGALEGVMVEAIAAANNLPPGNVRRAAMVSGDLTLVAVAARGGGTAALSGFLLAFSPVRS